MSLFNKMLASVGIGAAKVDTRIERTNYLPGDEIRGEVLVWGGSSAQRVDDIYLDLMTHYRNDGAYVEQSLIHYRLSERFELPPGSQKSIPFAVRLPWQTPATLGHFPVWIRTGLDVAGIDPKDRDPINIDLLPVQSEVIRAVESLGFRLYKVDSEFAPRVGGQFPFVQEFEFRPMTSANAYHIEELEIMFRADASGADVFLNVDRRERGLGVFFDDMGSFRDQKRRLRFENGHAVPGSDVIRRSLSDAISGALV